MKAKVCVALPTSNYLHRQMLEGVVDYSREHSGWQLFLVTDDDGVAGLRQARSWGANGAIAIGRYETWAREIFGWRVPSVLFNCMMRRRHKRTVYLQRDQARVGCTAAEYFLDRGHESFAFVGSPESEDWSDKRLEGYRRRLSAAGYGVAVGDFRDGKRAMHKFLSSLPGGTALFAAHDRSAQRILGLCLEYGIAVPERLAVLGVADDRVICEAMTPQLSSISLDGVNTGRLAATLLDELLEGRKVEPTLKLDFPRVITRQSTDTNAISDIVISRTLAKITADFSRPLKLGMIAAELGYSVRTLEIKARRVFGCTLQEKVGRLRLNEAVRLLTNTSLPIQTVAERCGFCGASHLGMRMKAAFGYPPSIFRY